MTASRDAMLAAVRAAKRTPLPRPNVRDVARGFSTGANLVEQFVESAKASGAHVVEGQRGDVSALIASAYPSTGRQVSGAGEIDARIPLEATPHSFADTDVFVCEAVIGVAENGAVWLPLSRLRYRSAVFLTSHVVVLLDAVKIVQNFHVAYASIDASAEGFGMFLAGPSKTADIEQALVEGAHGAKSVTVVLLRS